MRDLIRLASVATLTALALAACVAKPQSEGASPASAASPSPTVAATIDPDTPLEDQLLAALRDGDVALTELLVAEGVDVDVVFTGGTTPLQLAASRGDAALTEAVLRGGPDIDAGGAVGEQALALACRQDSPEVIALLLDAGADPAFTPTNEARDYLGRAPIHWCAYHDSVGGLELMLETGLVDVDYGQRLDNATPLTVAAYRGNVQAAEFLIDHGADPGFVDDFDNTPLSWARQERNETVIQLLCLYVDCES